MKAEQVIGGTGRTVALTLVYKCRRCEVEFHQEAQTDMPPSEYLHAASPEAAHQCHKGSFAFADLIGVLSL